MHEQLSAKNTTAVTNVITMPLTIDRVEKTFSEKSVPVSG